MSLSFAFVLTKSSETETTIFRGSEGSHTTKKPPINKVIIFLFLVVAVVELQQLLQTLLPFQQLIVDFKNPNAHYQSQYRKKEEDSTEKCSS